MAYHKIGSLVAACGLAMFGSAFGRPGFRRSAAGDSGATISGFVPTAFREASPLVETTNTLSLTRKSSRSSSSRLLHTLRGTNTAVDGSYGTSSILPAAEGQVFLTAVQFGDEWFEAVIDTGSSDTWLAESGFRCVSNSNRSAEPESYCKFGSTYNISSTFTQIPNENFNITYGDGEFLSGIVGYEKVTLANITVEKQEVGVVDYASWFGDGVSAGLIGFGYPLLTSAYYGTNPTLDNRTKQAEYNPIFTKMYEDGNVAPLFTLVIERGNDTGTLAIGGLPPGLPPYEAHDFGSAAIQILQLQSNPAAATQYSFYIIYPDGFVYRNASSVSGHIGHSVNPFHGTPKGWKPIQPQNDTVTTDFPVIVDSGTTLIYLPTGIADSINTLFSPPAYFSDEAGADVVDCNATAPDVGVTIGGKTFFLNPADLILDGGLSGGLCMSGIQDNGGGLSILGDVFLKNVIAVFDVGAAEMRFAPHEYY